MTFDFNRLIEPDMEIGTQNAFRFWRYTNKPVLKLQSFVASQIWLPGKPVESSVSPDDFDDVYSPGIHGFKTLDNLVMACRGTAETLVSRSHISGCDGVIVGTIDLWGIVWEHQIGYRGQFAKPTSFIYAYGHKAATALEKLRKDFNV